MKILFLSADLCDGGTQRVISVISNKLAQKGLDIYMYLFCKSEKDFWIDKKIKLEVMCSSYQEYYKLSGFQRLRNVRKYLRKTRPDIAIGFLQAGYALYLASIGMDIIRIASIRNNPQKIDESSGMRAIINRFWLKHADVLVLQNESQREYIERKKWKNAIVIPNPINETISLFEKKIYINCSRIIMVGRLVEQKNYLLALLAMKELCDLGYKLTLHIYGEGPLKENLIEIIKENELNNNVFLHGWAENIYEEYKESDIYLLTSLYEGMPNALMEAMAIGLPCIATDCPTGPRDLIEKNGKMGFLVPADDADKLVSTIRGVIHMSADQRKEIGINARRKILEEFSSESVVNKWLYIFERVNLGAQK